MCKFHIRSFNLNFGIWPKFTRVVKKQLESQQRQLGKTVVVKAGAYIVSMDRKTTVYRVEAAEIAFFEEHVPSCS